MQRGQKKKKQPVGAECVEYSLLGTGDRERVQQKSK